MFVALLKGITSLVRQEDWLDWHYSSKGIPWDETLSLLFLRNRNSYLLHLIAAFLIDMNKTPNQGLEPKQVCSVHRFSIRE
jgi:hypothetical protein